jgi:hypothetical protein
VGLLGYEDMPFTRPLPTHDNANRKNADIHRTHGTRFTVVEGNTFLKDSATSVIGTETEGNTFLT